MRITAMPPCQLCQKNMGSFSRNASNTIIMFRELFPSRFRIGGRRIRCSSVLFDSISNLEHDSSGAAIGNAVYLKYCHFILTHLFSNAARTTFLLLQERPVGLISCSRQPDVHIQDEQHNEPPLDQDSIFSVHSTNSLAVKKKHWGREEVHHSRHLGN